jgi:glycosyltransferase involved in cell wall biosynthesis
MENLTQITKQYNIVFVGPVRNCAPFLDKIFNNIERIGSLFKSYSCVFVESDSTDNSLQVLESYANNKNNIHVISLGKLEFNIPSRTKRIATARNVGIEYCEKSGILDSHEFYVQMCVDDVNSQEIDLNGVLSCFKYDLEQWDGMTANQNRYYDLWTLRCKKWLEYDCYYELNNRPEYMSYDDAVNIFIGSRFIYLPKEYGLIEVDSAHGGLSIYKSSIAKGCRYSGFNQETNSEESDILQFCRDVKHKGGKIFINTELININNN